MANDGDKVQGEDERGGEPDLAAEPAPDATPEAASAPESTEPELYLTTSSADPPASAAPQDEASKAADDTSEVSSPAEIPPAPEPAGAPLRLLEATPESTGSETPRAIFATVLVALLLTGAGNVFGGEILNEHTTNLGYFMIHKKWQMLEKVDGSHNWIVFGDSSCAHSFEPAVFDKHVRAANSFNYCVIANMIVANDAWMLAEYIRLHGPPEKVVLIHSMDVWHRGYNSKLLAKVPRHFGYWERLEPKLDLPIRHQWNIFRGKYLQIYAENSSASKLLRGKGAKETWFSMDEDGYIPGRSHRAGRYRRDKARTLKTLKRKRTKRISGPNRRALVAIGELATKHDFDVFIVHGPIASEIAKLNSYKQHQRIIKRRVKRVIAPFPRVRWIDAEFPFPAKQMETTVDHTSPAAAKRYTRRLARTLQKASAWGAKR